jgi:hypothetical protein
MMSESGDAVDPETVVAARPAAAVDPAAVRAILGLVQARWIEKSICPTDAARVMAAESQAGGGAGEPEAWRRFLPPVRAAAVHLAQTGRIDILRKGKRIAPDAVHGVIRLRLAADREDT